MLPGDGRSFPEAVLGRDGVDEKVLRLVLTLATATAEVGAAKERTTLVFLEVFPPVAAAGRDPADIPQHHVHMPPVL